MSAAPSAPAADEDHDALAPAPRGGKQRGARSRGPRAAERGEPRDRAEHDDQRLSDGEGPEPPEQAPPRSASAHARPPRAVVAARTARPSASDPEPAGGARRELRVELRARRKPSGRCRGTRRRSSRHRGNRRRAVHSSTRRRMRSRRPLALEDRQVQVHAGVKRRRPKLLVPADRLREIVGASAEQCGVDRPPHAGARSTPSSRSSVRRRRRRAHAPAPPSPPRAPRRDGPRSRTRRRRGDARRQDGRDPILPLGRGGTLSMGFASCAHHRDLVYRQSMPPHAIGSGTIRSGWSPSRSALHGPPRSGVVQPAARQVRVARIKQQTFCRSATKCRALGPGSRLRVRQGPVRARDRQELKALEARPRRSSTSPSSSPFESCPPDLLGETYTWAPTRRDKAYRLSRRDGEARPRRAREVVMRGRRPRLIRPRGRSCSTRCTSRRRSGLRRDRQGESRRSGKASWSSRSSSSTACPRRLPSRAVSGEYRQRVLDS